MRIHAVVESSAAEHRAVVGTDGRVSSLAIPGRPGGGSSANGGELLCLALATCYCNDVYREAAKLGIAVRGVSVTVAAEFGGPGEPARRITYSARVESDAPPDAVVALLRHTDAVAEVHNTLRAGTRVERVDADAPHGTGDAASRDAASVVGAWLAAVNAGDADGALALTTPDVTIVGPRGAARGQAVLRQWLALAGATFETRAIFARGDAVVVAQRGVWRDPATGAPRGEADVATRFRVVDGRVAELERHDARDAALDAAGLTTADAV